MSELYKRLVALLGKMFCILFMILNTTVLKTDYQVFLILKYLVGSYSSVMLLP